MARILIQSSNPSAINAFIAGIEFDDKPTVFIIDVNDTWVLLDDTTKDDNVTYSLSEDGELKFVMTGIEY